MTEEVNKDFPFTPEQLQWIEALESGKYNQCSGALAVYNDDNERVSHCCLGVAMELFKPNSSFLKKDSEFDSESKQGKLTAEVTKKLKLRDNMGIARNYWPETKLTDFNDQGVSFKEIAEILRKNPEMYFTNLDKKK